MVPSATTDPSGCVSGVAGRAAAATAASVAIATRQIPTSVEGWGWA